MKVRRKTFSPPPGRGRGPLKGWLGLAFGLAALWFLTFVALPLGQKLPFVAPWMAIVAERDINASAYYYTQLDETAEGSLFVRKKLEGMK